MKYFRSCNADVLLNEKLDNSRNENLQRVIKVKDEFGPLILSTEQYELWQKIKPRKHGDKYYVVKTFATDQNGLPYELVKSTVAIDSWFFGALLFCLISTCSLLPVNRDEDFVDEICFDILYVWSHGQESNLKKLVLIVELVQ